MRNRYSLIAFVVVLLLGGATAAIAGAGRFDDITRDPGPRFMRAF